MRGLSKIAVQMIKKNTKYTGDKSNRFTHSVQKGNNRRLEDKSDGKKKGRRKRAQ